MGWIPKGVLQGLTAFITFKILLTAMIGGLIAWMGAWLLDLPTAIKFFAALGAAGLLPIALNQGLAAKARISAGKRTPEAVTEDEKQPEIKLTFSCTPACVSHTTVNDGKLAAVYYKFEATAGSAVQDCEAYLTSVEKMRHSGVFESIWPHEKAKILWANKGLDALNRPIGCQPVTLKPPLNEYACVFIKVENEDYLRFEFCVPLNRYKNFKIEESGIYRIVEQVISEAGQDKQISLIVDYDKTSENPIKVTEESEWRAANT